ncbi:Diaminopimelate epimerase [Nocardioides aquaticus]|uniref:Diaminopimelate epimerase n=1 Tax=Nocardioides aquaticus TaxID=160826 RepID=A0ABX8EMP3_9ACTN|nr:diaminopimelate epimerase [Nocardioides aquaticus]QVT81544.1 Diaminopimelate epimerase [Nocardioides aquaticus]
MSAPYPFLKGHGTENDFVLLPDHDGTVHGGLDEDAWQTRVRALCHRRAGIGGDGVLRVVRSTRPEDGTWFMDYRNADGSVSEMCGNGVRVFALHLVQEGLVDPAAPIAVGTRDGVKTVTVEDDGRLTVDMGLARLLGTTEVSLDGRTWPATHVDVGNPHAVAFLADGEDLDGLSGPGQPLAAPAYDAAVYPAGVNVELVVRRGPHHVALRVHERGSGETRSCGTGACAVMAAAAAADGAPEGTAYRVDVPGGTLSIAVVDGRVRMTGPAVVLARGTTTL